MSSRNTDTHPSQQSQFGNMLNSIPDDGVWYYNESSAASTARILYAAEFNVIPAKRATKYGFKGWAGFRTTRLHPDYLTLFDNPVNVAVLTGHTSRNLVAVDCETGAELDRYLGRARRLGLDFWAVKSGGTKGGGVLLLRCSEGCIADIPLTTMRADFPDAGEVEVWGSGTQYVMVPPSVHPDTGALYEWIAGHAPQDMDYALPAHSLNDLRQILPMIQIASRRGTQNKTTNWLHPQTMEFLREGAQIGERNARLFRAACDIYGSELEGDPLDHSALWDQLIDAARSCNNTGDEVFSDREIFATIRSAKRQNRVPARMSNTGGPQRWEKAVTYAETRHWTGRTGATDRAVFMACCERLRYGGSGDTFRASCREIAEIANCNRNTAEKALRRLTEQGLLQNTGTDWTSRANLYKFGKQVFETQITIVGTLSPLEDSVLNSVTQNINYYRALGRVAALVWQKAWQRGGCLTRQETADLCGISARQAGRAWNKLLSYGYGNLALRTTNYRYEALDPGDDWIIENVLAPVGAVDIDVRRKQQHAAERAKRASVYYEQQMIIFFRSEAATLRSRTSQPSGKTG